MVHGDGENSAVVEGDFDARSTRIAQCRTSRALHCMHFTAVTLSLLLMRDNCSKQSHTAPIWDMVVDATIGLLSTASADRDSESLGHWQGESDAPVPFTLLIGGSHHAGLVMTP